MRGPRFGREARRALRDTGLDALGWRWAWLRLEDHPEIAAQLARKGVLGLCDLQAKTLYFDRAHVLLDDWPEVRDTLAHEIAHALSGAVTHCTTWRKWARACGARPTPH